MFSSEAWLSNSSNFYNGVATQSLRFDDGSSAYLTFTTGSASSSTDRRKVTHSVWVKRGVLGVDQTIYSGNRSGGGDYYLFRFSSDNKLTLILDVDTGGYGYDTSAVFRDVGAWYHVCVIIDTTQATDTDRVKIYVNGVLQDKTTKYAGGHVAQNFSTYVMDGSEDEIGRFAFTDASYFDGYMAEFITTIGQDNTISEFGELKNGVWIPKAYTGSYGTNGFRLQFNQTGTGTASSSTIGADTSGNDNHFSSSGIVASDCDMPDSPENNWCTLSSIQNQTSATLSDGNLKAVGTSANWDNLQSTFAVTSGKWYWEVKATSVSEANSFVAGIHETGFPAQSLFWFSGSYTTSAYGTAFGVLDPDNKVTNGSATAFTLGLATNDIIQFRLNLDDNELSVSIDGSDKGKIYDITANIEYTPALCLYNTSSATMNFGQDSTFAGTETAGGNADENGNGDFAYAPPSGYLALCSANLPEPTISPNEDTQADDYFNTSIWTGNSTNNRTITNLGFQPDWVWIKRRDGADNHFLQDSIRGADKQLFSNLTDAEFNNTNQVKSFDSDGFTLGTDGGVNVTGRTYVGWSWKAGGTAVSNTDGTITTSVSANTDAGFSIVSYTGNGSGTIGHGLGVTPDFFFIKNRDQNTYNWNVWHKTFTGGQVIYLNLTNARNTDTNVWNNTLPTSTVISVDNIEVNNSGDEHIAYCFAEIDGYSKFGSYTGNGSTDGTFVYTGFRPAFVMVKDTGVADWDIQDTTRSPFNPSVVRLWANLSSAEVTSTYDIDFLSNGFKLRSTNPDTNSNGDTKIYMAFADGQPFKYANAR